MTTRSGETGKGDTGASAPGSIPSRVRKVLIVDDHPLVRAGLSDLLGGEPGLEICGEAWSVEPARRLIRERQPDLVVLDLSLADGNGVDLLRDESSRDPSIKILIFSAHDERGYAEKMVACGASGYVGKDEPAESVLAAVRCVLAGGIYFSERIRRIIRQRRAGR